MKQLLIASLLLLPTLALAQSTKPDQYCILKSDHKAKDRAALKLLVGADPAKTGQVEEMQQIASLEHEADALNYLSSHGWEVISVTPITNGAGDTGVRYCLRRHQP